MIKPTSRKPGAAVDPLVPRVLLPSEVTTSGDKVEVLRPRHGDDMVFGAFLDRHLPRRRRYDRFPLDPRGSRIWCLIDNRRTVEEIIAEYRRFYPADERQIDDRVRRYLQTLADHGFIEIVAG